MDTKLILVIVGFIAFIVAIFYLLVFLPKKMLKKKERRYFLKLAEKFNFKEDRETKGFKPVIYGSHDGIMVQIHNTPLTHRTKSHLKIMPTHRRQRIYGAITRIATKVETSNIKFLDMFYGAKHSEKVHKGNFFEHFKPIVIPDSEKPNVFTEDVIQDLLLIWEKHGSVGLVYEDNILYTYNRRGIFSDKSVESAIDKINMLPKIARRVKS